MRRFVTVVALLFFTIPFGISVTGCSKKAPIVYCDGGDSGAVTGQLTTITLQPKIFGISLNEGEIGQTSTPTATDCKGSSVSISSYTYATSNMSIVDIQPSTGKLCGGSWNRNSGGGIADFTTCTATGDVGVAYITATAGGISSNPIPVYIHPVVTGVVLGAPSSNCATDPATNCSPAAINSAIATSAIAGCPTSTTYPTNTQLANGCCTVPPNTVFASSLTPVTPYTGSGCLSQGTLGQLSARVYAGAGSSQTNISCQVGQVSYTPQTSTVVSIDQNGVATAVQPGSSVITTVLSQAGSSAGYFSTCPPVDIALSYPQTASGTTNIIVDPNNTQSITATATDVNGVQLTGLTLEYLSTTPTTIPASSGGTVTPIFPGFASITAICQPPTCNPAPYSEIGLYGNGKPVASKPLTVTTPGTNSTDLYIGSTNSQYLVPVDFTQSSLGAPIRLPYVPNSMVLSTDGSTLYLGSSTELMVVSTTTGQLTTQNTSITGTVLAVSPNNADVLINDPIRQLIYLYTSSGTVSSTYGYTQINYPNSINPIPLHAAWTPDSETAYIAAGNEIIVYSAQTGWNTVSLSNTVYDTTVTVPNVGAYFAGSSTNTIARGYCPATSITANSGTPPSTTNQFYPAADSVAAFVDRLAAATTTSDGLHIIGASATTGTSFNKLTDISVNLAPVPYTTAGGSLSPSGTASPLAAPPSRTRSAPVPAWSRPPPSPGSSSPRPPPAPRRPTPSSLTPAPEVWYPPTCRPRALLASAPSRTSHCPAPPPRQSRASSAPTTRPSMSGPPATTSSTSSTSRR